MKSKKLWNSFYTLKETKDYLALLGFRGWDWKKKKDLEPKSCKTQVHNLEGEEADGQLKQFSGDTLQCCVY